MRYLKNTHIDPYFNMAFDEYCLEKLSIDEPVFFLSGWQTQARKALFRGLANAQKYAMI